MALRSFTRVTSSGSRSGSCLTRDDKNRLLFGANHFREGVAQRFEVRVGHGGDHDGNKRKGRSEPLQKWQLHFEGVLAAMRDRVFPQ